MMKEVQQMESRFIIVQSQTYLPSAKNRRGMMDRLEMRKMQNRNFLKSNQSQVHKLKYSTNPNVTSRIADTTKSTVPGDLGQKYQQVNGEECQLISIKCSRFINATQQMAEQTKYVWFFRKFTKHLLISSTFILLNLGQKHRETLNVLMANNANGSYLIILYRIPNTSSQLLPYILHLLPIWVLLVMIRPIRLNRLQNKKHSEQMMVDAGPSWRTGNSSRLSSMRMIVTTVMEN